ncbi:MAG: chemotaxis protein CheW [Robiginitomaculum sp.]|nr:chemotaxis protein CheW [Robiginitomaculum sp.]
MNNEEQTDAHDENSDTGPICEFVTLYIGEQVFGIAVDDIREVFHPHAITRVPLAPPEIRGVLNLRGRIVTAIEVRTRLNLPPLEQDSNSIMAIGVEVENEAFGLIIDRVGDVLQLPERDCEPIPSNMDPVWQRVSSGIYRLEGQLLIILDIQRLLGIEVQTDLAA